ncbi:unnamed protein product [Meganyctiphanes norvegica]|uniref:Ras GTPase-activating protein n=1 Tax=Meganyctiphanes norvegica TaxID=48144 RepID=A0AAV2PJ65_MEGNR
MQLLNWLSFGGPPDNNSSPIVFPASALRDCYNTDTSYEKACGSDRRGSAPATPILGGRGTAPHESPTPNKLVNFFSKRSFKSNPLKRTKSVTKLERAKLRGIPGGGSGFYPTGEAGVDPLTPGGTARLRSSRSHESLLSSQNVMNTLDLTTGDVTIKPLHSSILGQDHCFQVTSQSGIRYFSCRTADERDRWVDSLRKAINPNIDHMRRTENSLKIFILEAKGVSTKKRYFCEVLLDGSLYSRTSSKSKSDMCFWGEQFEFQSLPPVETISVALYREPEKKRKKEKNILVGIVNIPVTSVLSRSYIEKWYQVQPDNNKNANKDLAALRIKCKFQTVDILPLELYTEFLQFVKNHYRILCQVLEPAVSVKAKEDIATSLVHIMQREGRAQHFLADLVMLEFERIDDAHLLFRGNSLATKAMEAFMKLVGEKYLLDTLRQVINRVVEAGLDCEVDPMKMTQINTLQKQQENLLSVVRMMWSRILNSHPYFPLELRECFNFYRERLSAIGKEDLTDNLISASIFLRFLCPAILSPSLFNITQEYPDERASRNLTLIAKTLQTLANFTKFQGKENFMEFMNEFIEAEQAQMRIFLKQISSPISHIDHRGAAYEGDIDTGKQLSLLDTLLTETVCNVSDCNSNGPYQKELNVLHNILEDLSIAKAQPNAYSVQRFTHTNTTTTVTETINSTQNAPSLEDKINYQSLQRNIFRYNDPTVPDIFPQPVIPIDNGHDYSQPESPTTPRPSTLPRNTYLMGSARKPAVDLNTADDYVLFSALECEKPRARNPIGHSYSHSHLGPSLQQSVPTPVHSNQPHLAHHPHYHHHHFHNHAGWYNNPRQPVNGHVQLNGNNNTEESLNISHEENDGNSLGETESNLKGSQTSISQLSNVASSGYQSFAYSQSSSPVDPTIITHHDHANNNNTSVVNNNNHINMTNTMHNSPKMGTNPLVFNNPMYHLDSHGQPVSTPRPVPGRPGRVTPHILPYHQMHHQPVTHNHSPISSSLSSAHSVEELTSTPSMLPKSQVGAMSPLLTRIGHSSSSEDLKSLVRTPPEVRSRAAPRTNPRCLPPGRAPQPGSPARIDHHHSTSDLVGPHNRRSKMSRRQSAEPSGCRRHPRYQYDSDSSSDGDQLTHQPRIRPHRLQQNRVSETKTLDEYEQEILALRTAMEEMHHKLVSAEETLTTGKPTPSDRPKIQQNHSNHLQSDIINQKTNKHPQSQTNVSNNNSSNGSRSNGSLVKGQQSSYQGGTPMHKSSNNRNSKAEQYTTAKNPPTQEQDVQNAHMRHLLSKLLEIQKEFQVEKTKMCEIMNEKNAVIQAQEDRMGALERTNDQLLMALEQIRELNKNNEGSSDDKSGDRETPHFSDTSDYKSSSF